MIPRAIPIPVEPAKLGFALNCRLTGVEPTLAEFHRFTVRMRAFFDELERAKLRIALTEELYHLLLQQVPFTAYEDAPNAKVVAELMFRRLGERMRTVHQFGDHNYEVTIVAGLLDEHQLTTTDETYLLWLDLLALMLIDRLPAAIVQEPGASVLSGNECELATTAGTSSKAVVVDTLSCAALQPPLALWRLAQKVNSIPATSVPCTGTGDHSSMWGSRRIRALEDVPEFEREFLEALACSGLVSQITLLAFDTPRAPVAEPFIEIVDSDDSGKPGLILGLLRGRGRKQNAQRVALQVTPDLAPLILQAFGKEIRLSGLLRMFHITQWLSERKRAV